MRKINLNLVSWLACAALLLPLGQEAIAQDSISMNDSIRATIDTHRSLKSIQENREVLVHELDRARRGYGPRVDVSGAIGINRLSNSTTRLQGRDKAFYDSGRISAILTQPVWDGLATRSRIRATRATMNSMSHRVLDNATTLALDAIIAHIDVLRSRQIYTLAQANVARHQEILAQARDREFLGQDTIADVMQAESRLARALSTLVENRTNLLAAEETYFRLTQTRPSPNLMTVPMPTDMYLDTADIMTDVLKHNPKLNAYMEDVNASKNDAQLSRSAYHPVINLEAGPSYSVRDTGYTGNLGEKNWTYSFDVMATLRWNIFNSGADQAAEKAAAARVRQARQYMYSAVDDFALEVEKTWNDYIAAQEQHSHYLNAVTFNTATRDAYQEQFIMGSRSLLDVLDTESELFNSASQVATTQSNILIGAYRLIAITGTLLRKVGVEEPTLFDTPAPPPDKHPWEDKLPWERY